MFTKVQQQDLEGKGVVGQATVPGLSVREMQESVEQIVREVAIPAVNRLVDELAAASAAENIGAQQPGEEADGGATLQEVLESLERSIGAHAENTENPHAVTAGQTGPYSRAETDRQINAKIVEIGTGDMAQGVYDPQGKKADVFAAIPAPNLLDNADFSAPVNQRGRDVFSSDSEMAYGGPDRWMQQNAEFRASDHTLRAAGAGSGRMRQIVSMAEKGVRAGDTLTASVRADGKTVSGSGVLQADGATVLIETETMAVSVRMDGEADVLMFDLECRKAGTEAVSVEHVKLEKGAVPTEWQPRGFAAELAECQRYYQEIPFDYAYVQMQETGYAEKIPVSFRTVMRATPSVTFWKNWDSGVQSIAAEHVFPTGCAVALQSFQSGTLMDVHYTLKISADL